MNYLEIEKVIGREIMDSIGNIIKNLFISKYFADMFNI